METTNTHRMIHEDFNPLIRLDPSSQVFIPLSRFIRSRHSTLLVTPSLVLFPPRSAKRHMLGVYLVSLLNLPGIKEFIMNR